MKFHPLLVVILIFISQGAFAQFSKPVSIGIGVGGTKLHTDLSENPMYPSGHLDLDMLVRPFVSVGLNAQKGTLAGSDSDGRDVKNNYSAINANIKVRLGQFMRQANNYSYYMMSAKTLTSYLANVYVGAGAGFIFNDVDAKRVYKDGSLLEAFEGPDKRTEMIVPLNVGIDIPLGRSLYGPTWAININYQYAISLDNGLDGYANEVSKSSDQYSYFSVGVKVALFNKK